MGQNIGTVVQNQIGGTKTALNVTAAGVISTNTALARLAKIVIIAPGTTGDGSLTVHDSNSLVTAQTITAITAANQAVVTVSTSGSSNPFAVGNTIAFASVGGMTQINTVVGQVTAIGGASGAWTITTNINSSAFTAYTSGGTAASFSAQTELYTISAAVMIALVAAGTPVIDLEFPIVNGIIVSAVPSAGSPQYNFSFT